MDKKKKSDWKISPEQAQASRDKFEKYDRVKSGGKFSKDEYTKADYVLLDDKVFTDGIEVNSVNKNTYMKNVGTEENPQWKEASYGDRFESAMQKSFVNSVAGAPVDLAMDSIYTGFVSHGVRDLVKGVIYNGLLKKLDDWWDRRKKVVCDVAFQAYSETGLYSCPFLNVSGNNGLLSSPMYPDTEVKSLNLNLAYDDLPEINDEEKEDDKEGSGENSGGFFHVSQGGVGNMEFDFIGTLSLNIPFKTIADIEALNGCISAIGHKAHISMKFRSRQKGFLPSFKSLKEKEILEYDAELTKVDSLEFDASDSLFKRTYTFRLLKKRKADIEITFPSKDMGVPLFPYYGFYSQKKDEVTYHINCGSENSASTVIASCAVDEYEFENTLSLFSSVKNASSAPIDTASLDSAALKIREAANMGNYESAALIFNTRGGSISPFEYLQGLDLFELESREDIKEIDSSLKNMTALGFSVADGQATKYKIIRTNLKFRYSQPKISRLPSYFTPYEPEQLWYMDKLIKPISQERAKREYKIKMNEPKLSEKEEKNKLAVIEKRNKKNRQQLRDELIRGMMKNSSNSNVNSSDINVEVQ